MEKIILCVGTHDGNTIADTHMGDTRTFLIYELTADLQSRCIGQRQNIHQDLDHAQTDKMKRILELIKDVDILVARQKSPNFIKMAKQTRYQPVVVDTENIEEAIRQLRDHYAELKKLINHRRQGNFSAEIPVYQ